MLKTYSASIKKTVFLFLIFVLVLGLIFSFAKGTFEIYGFGLGAFFGAVFGSFVLFFGLGQKITVSDIEIFYYSNLLELILRKPRKKLRLSEISEVRLGLPRVNRKATFAAINIATSGQEITFNPDLFDKSALQKLFKELRGKNSNISFDRYAISIIEKGKGEAMFTKKVLINFILTAVLMLAFVLLDIVAYRADIISRTALLIVLGIQLLFLPFIYNWLAKILKKN